MIRAKTFGDEHGDGSPNEILRTPPQQAFHRVIGIHDPVIRGGNDDSIIQRLDNRQLGSGNPDERIPV